MTNDIIQLLISTRAEQEPDIESTVAEITEPGLLTERQAEALLRAHLTTAPVKEIAEEMGVSESRIYNARQTAEKKLRAAEETLAAAEQAINPYATADAD